MHCPFSLSTKIEWKTLRFCFGLFSFFFSTESSFYLEQMVARSLVLVSAQLLTCSRFSPEHVTDLSGLGRLHLQDEEFAVDDDSFIHFPLKQMSLLHMY